MIGCLKYASLAALCSLLLTIGYGFQALVIVSGGSYRGSFALNAFISPSSSPPHIILPRVRMNQSFAVQLMRSSYNTVDDLDFVPMDQFQKDFFLFRQSQWEDYLKNHRGLFQGDLADPVYFDFISFAQYAVIAEKIRTAKQSFIERTGATGDANIVRRDRRFADDKSLTQTHSDIVGQSLLRFLQNATRESNGIEQTVPPFTNLVSYLSVADIFLSLMIKNGFAWSYQLTPTIDSLFTLTLQAPANCWSLQYLIRRQDQPVNDFEVKLLNAVAASQGFKVERKATRIVNKVDVQHDLIFLALETLAVN